MPTYELLPTHEVLALKLSMWETRLKYAKGARRAECEVAVADLKAKIAAL